MANTLNTQNVNEVSLIEVDNDPSIGSGTPAPQGSLAFHKASGGVWIKRYPADTGWEPISTSDNSINYGARYEVHDDFTTNLNVSALGWTALVYGTGSSVSMGALIEWNSDYCVKGLNLTAGIIPNGCASILRDMDPKILDSRVCTQEWRIFLPKLSTSIDSFFVRIGFMNSVYYDSIDGVYFRYNHALNGGQWQCVFRHNNAETVVNSTIPVVAGQVINLTVRLDHQASATYIFYVNDILAGAITSSLGLADLSKHTKIGASIINNRGTDYSTMVIGSTTTICYNIRHSNHQRGVHNMANTLNTQNVNEVSLIEVDNDPSIGSGTPAPQGSLAFHKASGGVWIKRFVPDTGWEPISTSPNYRARYEVHDDFTTNLNVSELGWSTYVSGEGSSVESLSVSTNPLIEWDSVPWARCLKLTTGIRPNGYASIWRGINQKTLRNCIYTQEWCIFLPKLSNRINSFFVQIGFMEGISRGSVDGVYFRYNHTLNDGQWECVFKYYDSETVVKSSVPVVAGQAINLTIKSDYRTSATYTFYVNGILAGTITPSFRPDDLSRRTKIGASIIKSRETDYRTMFIRSMTATWLQY